MAHEAYPGRNMWIGVGIQSAVDTVATVFTYFQPTEVGGFMDDPAEIASNRRMGTRFKGLPYLGTNQIPFSFTVEADPGSIGRILRCGVGPDSVATIATGVYTHTFNFTEDLVYATIRCYAGGVADISGVSKFFEALNCKFDKLSLKGGIDDVMTLACDGIGTDVSAISSVTPSFTTDDPWFLNSAQGTGILSIGATYAAIAAFSEAREFQFDIANAVKADHRIHGSAAAIAVIEGDSEITGNMLAVYNDETFDEIAAFQAGTLRAFKLVVSPPTAFSSTYKKDLIIAITKAKYSGAKPNWDPDVMTVPMPFRVEENTTSLYISVQNERASAYSSSG